MDDDKIGGCFLYGLAIIWIFMGISWPSDDPSRTGLILLAMGVGLLVFGVYQSSKKQKATKENNAEFRNERPERSEWENSIARMVEHEAYGHQVVRNDRSTIPGRYGGNNLEIDIYIPSLKLGFEANGEHWHDHAAYQRDKSNGTAYSDEMYKEQWCKKNGIRLVHLWDSQSDDEIRRIVKQEIASKQGY